MSDQLPVVVAIPARYASTRLPGKPLRQLAGQAMILHVVERARALEGARVLVATDDERIAAVVRAAGTEVVLTHADHLTGTDRLAEVADQLDLHPAQIVVNLQGDEPLLPRSCLAAVVTALQRDPSAAIATLALPLETAAELFDPNVVKVVCAENGHALYFSRAPLPWARDAFARDRERLPEGVPLLRHVGLYAYRAGALMRLAALPPTALERAESLEQLRALGHGLQIVVDPAPERIPAGVDTEDDLRRVEAEMQLRAAPRWSAAAPAPAAPRVQARSIAFVCMGNICRSPLSMAYAQRMARERGLGGRLRLESRGTHAARPGAAADLRTMMVARARGLDLSGHRASPVDDADFFNFDLLVAHDQRNLDDLRAQCPPGLHHKLRLLLEFAPDSDAREIPDPYHGDHSDFILADELIRRGLDGLFAQLDPAPSRSPLEPR